MARSLSLALLAGVIALGAALAPAVARDGATATVEVTVWRSVADPSRLWLSTRAEGGRWRTEREPLDLSTLDEAGRFHRGNAIAVAVPLADGGVATVEVAVWRSAAEPSLLYVATRAEGGHWRTEAEPLDLSALSASGRFHRSAIVAVRVPLPFVAPTPDPRLVEACSNGVAVPDPEANPGLVNDCAILLEARDILDGEGEPLGWSADKPVGPGWRGVTVEGTPLRVTDVWLVGHGIDLRGQLPPVLAGLSHLQHLWIASALTGPLPPEYGQLVNLEDLWLHGNQLTGSIPPEFGSISALYRLWLSGNRLTGTIPPELGQLANLTYLELNGNQLSGGIPPELGALPQLYHLELDGNQLTGTIPPELALLPELQELDLKNNQLTGAIPQEFASFADLRELDLRDNQLTGQIPAKLSASFHFDWAWLGGNRFTGCLPLDLREIVPDRGALGLRFCQCPLSPPEERDSSTLTYGADGLPFLPADYYGYTSIAGTYRVSYSLVVDLPEGGVYKLGRRWRTDDGDIRTSIREEASQSYLVIDPFTGEEHARVAVDGPADCAANPSALLDRIAASARARPLAIPPDPDGARPLPFLEPVTGDGGSWRVAVGDGPRDGTSLVFDAPEGMILTLQNLYGVINGAPTYVVVLRDEESGSGIQFSATTNAHSSVGDEWTRNVTEAGEARGVGALFDRIAASAREGPPPSCDMPAIAPDCAILLDAKATLAGEAALNWSRDVPLEDWDGIVVDRRTVRIAWLNLPETGLTGRIPPSLGRLSRLEVLALNGNQLTGPIPPEIANIPGLRHIHLEHNRLTGAIPPELATVLGPWLDLSGNRLEGCIPAELSDFDIGEYGEPDSNPGLYRCDGSGPPTCARPETAPDCAVLLEARDTLAGTATLNWNAAVPLADWQGVTVDGETGRVARLILRDMGLTGSIPPVLGQLTGLTTLNFSRNMLTGVIPPVLGELKALETLSLFENQLTGAIPPELGSLTNLKNLWLNDNRLTGQIPPALGALASLEWLTLYDNQLTGEVPPELGQITGLAKLNFSRNVLTGVIPPVLGNLKALETLSLFENQLTGVIPSELGSLTNLKNLWLNDNRLTGQIPPALGALASLEWLTLNGNQLTGVIPPELGMLSGLEQVRLQGNRLEGCIPAGLGGIDIGAYGEPDSNPGLFRCDGSGPPTCARPETAPDCAVLLEARDTLAGTATLNWNATVPLAEWQGVTVDGETGRVVGLDIDLVRVGLTGHIPRALAQLSGLQRLWIYSTQVPVAAGLTGTIPPELGSLSNLRELVLNDHKLEGVMPPDLSRLANLEVLNLSNNSLSGSIPPELSSLSNIYALELHSNQLTGGIPPSLIHLSNLQTLGLSENQLSGTIPAGIGSLIQLDYLNLARNHLTGWIPKQLSELQNLRVLYLSDNELTGKIPPEIGSLVNLENLWIDGNNIKGIVPPELASLSNLQEMILGGNRLMGEIPLEFSQLQNLRTLWVDYQQLGDCVPVNAGVEVWAGDFQSPSSLRRCGEAR